MLVKGPMEVPMHGSSHSMCQGTQDKSMKLQQGSAEEACRQEPVQRHNVERSDLNHK